MCDALPSRIVAGITGAAVRSPEQTEKINDSVYYKRIDSGAVDAESPREDLRRRVEEEAPSKKVDIGERKAVREGERVEETRFRVMHREMRRSASRLESIRARIDFARAYLVDNVGNREKERGSPAAALRDAPSRNLFRGMCRG